VGVTEASVSARGTELCATIDIDAAPEDVWRYVTDVVGMPQRSPQVLRTVVFPSPLRLGSWLFNVNRSAWRVWPTSARVIRYEPFEEFAFRMNENFTVWSYRLERTAAGTRVIHRRETPQGISAPVRAAIPVVFGGHAAFTAELLEGMACTLEALKNEVEAAVA
jgi:uncharacterized protein YndB with AHSA1/START domain